MAQRATAVQVQATAPSVRAFYQSARTVPCGIDLVPPQARPSKTMPAAAVELSYVLLTRTQVKEYDTITPNYLYCNKRQIIIISVPD